MNGQNTPPVDRTVAAGLSDSDGPVVPQECFVTRYGMEHVLDALIRIDAGSRCHPEFRHILESAGREIRMKSYPLQSPHPEIPPPLAPPVKVRCGSQTDPE